MELWNNQVDNDWDNLKLVKISKLVELSGAIREELREIKDYCVAKYC